MVVSASTAEQFSFTTCGERVMIPATVSSAGLRPSATIRREMSVAVTMPTHPPSPSTTTAASTRRSRIIRAAFITLTSCSSRIAGGGESAETHLPRPAIGVAAWTGAFALAPWAAVRTGAGVLRISARCASGSILFLPGRACVNASLLRHNR
eukprot:scaffold1112_cov116-Isochrysis_galbana.AAC.32